MSSSRPGGPYVRADRPVCGVGVGRRDHVSGQRGVGRLSLERLHEPPGAVGVVEREGTLEAGAEDRDVLTAPPHGLGDGVEVEQAAEVDPVAAARRSDDRARAVRRGEDERAGERLEELARRGPNVEPVDANRVPLAADDTVFQLRAQCPRIVDLRHAEDALVPGREGLRDGRGGPQDVDHDPGRGRRGLVRRERHVNLHTQSFAR